MNADTLRAAREAIIRVIDCAAEVEVVTDTEEQAARDALRILAGIEAAPAADAAPSDAAWLIEQLGREAWLGNPRGCHPRNGWVWTTAEQAIRFAREEDAYAAAFALKLEPRQFKVTEHLWMDARQPQPADELFLSSQVAKMRAERDEANRRLDDVRRQRADNDARADRAVEALLGLVEACEVALSYAKGNSYSVQNIRGHLRPAVRTAREVLRG